MKIQELFEEIPEDQRDRRLVVIYGGRFQPFHEGHYQTYKWLCNRFKSANVWIATSNKKNLDPKKGDISPFSFAEKKILISGLYHVVPNRIVECENPAFAPKEIIEKYGKYNVIQVQAVGKKDISRYRENRFFDELPDDIKLPDEIAALTRELTAVQEGKGYYVAVPMQARGVSGTKLRQEMKSLKGAELENAFREHFGTYDSTLCALVSHRLGAIKDTDEEKQDKKTAERKEKKTAEREKEYRREERELSKKSKAKA